MRSRLTNILGKKHTTALQMGTFHSLCVRYLRMHSSVVGLDDNFTICDAEERYHLATEFESTKFTFDLAVSLPLHY